MQGICNKMNIGSLYYLHYKIDDLKSNQVLKQTSLIELKKKIDILVIDDDDFPLLEDLRKHEFNITYKNEIYDLKDVEAYQIILCDINGVGKFLGSDSDGAYLAYQIKNKYPDKVLISYTANNTSFKNQKYLDSVDRKIPKGTSIEDWASLLDEMIRNMVNPVAAWRNIVIKMVQNDVPTKEIASIEHKYVKAMLKNDFKSLEQLCMNESLNISSILKVSLPLIIEVVKTIVIA